MNASTPHRKIQEVMRWLGGHALTLVLAFLAACSPEELSEQASDTVVDDRVAVNEAIEDLGETVRDLVYHHQSKFSHLDPAKYFHDEDAFYLEMPGSDGVVPRSGLLIMEVDEALGMMVEMGALSTTDAQLSEAYLGEISAILSRGVASNRGPTCLIPQAPAAILTTPTTRP